MQELVKRNLRFVISVAKKYQNRGLPLTDLIGEGNVGLLTAARKFDPDQGVKFISYAVWWIRQAILASLARQGRTVRVPLNRTADLSRIVRDGRERCARSSAASRRRRRSPARPGSRSTWCSRSPRSTPPKSGSTRRSIPRATARSSTASSPTSRATRRAGDGQVPLGGDRAARSRTLPPRDAKVLRLYFGLDGGREHTLEEIGGMLGVTRERVRQLRDRALKRLREGEVGRALASFAA